MLYYFLLDFSNAKDPWANLFYILLNHCLLNHCLCSSRPPTILRSPPASGRRSPPKGANQTRTRGTVTKGAVDFAQIRANFAKTVDLHSLLLPTKFGQFCANPANFAQSLQMLSLSTIFHTTGLLHFQFTGFSSLLLEIVVSSKNDEKTVS